MKRKTKFPRGWNEARVRQIIDYYEKQTDEEAAAEDDAALQKKTRTLMSVPARLVPVFRHILASDEGRTRRVAGRRR